MIMAPVSFSAFRSASIFFINDLRWGSVIFSENHPFSEVGSPVGSSSWSWEHLASMRAHLFRASSTFFLAREIALSPQAATKPTHPAGRSPVRRS